MWPKCGPQGRLGKMTIKEKTLQTACLKGFVLVAEAGLEPTPVRLAVPGKTFAYARFFRPRRLKQLASSATGGASLFQQVIRPKFGLTYQRSQLRIYLGDK